MGGFSTMSLVFQSTVVLVVMPYVWADIALPCADGLHRHPTICSFYTQCHRGLERDIPCLSGLVWNPSTERCDYPKNVAGCSVPPPCPDGNYPHPTNCTSYIRCVKGQAIEMACPTGLVWNRSSGTCDFRANVHDCPDPEAPCPDGLYPHPRNCSLYIHCFQGKQHDMPCPLGLVWNPSTERCDYPKNVVSCSDPPPCPDGNYPHPTSCSSYIHCVKGQRKEMACTPGLVWNRSIGSCDFPAHVNCTETLCPDGLYPHPDAVNCSLYIHCFRGQQREMSCPPGLGFNQQIKKCDFQTNVPNC